MLPEPIELPEQRAVFFPELVGRGPPPQREQRWKAYYHDANGKRRQIGLYDTQEAAAHAVNAAIRRAGLVGKRRTNAVVDGQLRKLAGRGASCLKEVCRVERRIRT